MSPTISKEKFREILPKICDRETTQDPAGWIRENPLYGHCAVVSAVAQNIFGGELLRADLTHIPKFAHMRSHYWNRLSDGTEEDFTAPQFGNSYPTNLKPEVRERAYVLAPKFPETIKRYKLLTYRLARALNLGNPIFADPIYRECFYAALGSPCQKMWFGCVITHNGAIVAITCNSTIEPLKHLCEPTCIRFSIQSRTESMIGACGHAEELALAGIARQQLNPAECDLYVAGVYRNGFPWLKNELDHSCIRCATQQYNIGIRKIFIPLVDHWAGMEPAECLSIALKYALGEKKV